MTADANSRTGRFSGLGAQAELIRQRLESWQESEYAGRLWGRDASLWVDEETPEIENRLGWLDLPRTMVEGAEELAEFGREMRDAGFRQVVLLGMGGSSLAPEVFQETFGAAPGYPSLRVLDSTHPAAVSALAESLRLPETFFVVSSKSGTTLETLSLFRFFWSLTAEAMGGPDREAPGRHFAAVTDPGSRLHHLGSERGFRRVFLAPPDVGGRYSALSPFGLLPAALIGVHPSRLLGSAERMAGECGADQPAAENPGLVLGAALGESALAGRDKLTLLTTPGLRSFPDWIEQLVAESTGKESRGIVPIVGEPPRAVESYDDDRFFVGISLAGDGAAELDERLSLLEKAGHAVARFEMADPDQLGAEMYRWEVAVASAGSILGIHPFDQPDVQLAKKMAKDAMASPDTPEPADLPRAWAGDGGLQTALDAWLESSAKGDYLAIQAFLAPSDDSLASLDRLRQALGRCTGLATTAGWGPRFLHSTGQLHKGGADNGCFLQLVDAAAPDLPIPETDFGFERLVTAQALGDALALRLRNRRLLRVDLGESSAAGLAEVVGRLGG